VAAGEDQSLTGSHIAVVEVVMADYDQQSQDRRGHNTMSETDSGCHLLNKCQWRLEKYLICIRTTDRI